eukprot:CAMPEP_0198337376 /NCGR_PEP_ID=MMETSP1450-20131203/27607_1 /TAXON_ID=753684 ORGANISM="Madagascaria erythrocladiodes, Strain CCMP3234" /NCGR_SAMPLE_ID=MMETSP1450 /ASSEMBLY_ACC=CAM_ASM_001115 /LENGTH=44 /DNA_ID= /DNA_START= /DNA_END= /DNA_ORIENTATION=
MADPAQHNAAYALLHTKTVAQLGTVADVATLSKGDTVEDAVKLL